MIHHAQRLSLGLETGDDRAAVHSQFYDFQCHSASDRLVVKLPSGADPVMEGVSTSIEGKLVRYDVYLTGAPPVAGPR